MKYLNNFEGHSGNYWKIELHDYVASSLRDYTVKTKYELENLTKKLLSHIGESNVSYEDLQVAMDIVSSLINDESDVWKDVLEYYVNKNNESDIEKIVQQAIDNLYNDGIEILDNVTYEEILEEVEKILIKKDVKKFNV